MLQQSAVQRPTPRRLMKRCPVDGAELLPGDDVANIMVRFAALPCAQYHTSGFEASLPLLCCWTWLGPSVSAALHARSRSALAGAGSPI